MTSEVTQAALEPCPFCGGKAERFTLPEDEFGNGGGDVITCSRCQASSHVEFGRKENLVDRWNTRLNARQSGEGERESFPTKDAYMRACRALRWRHAELRAHGIEPMQITDDHPESPPVGYDFGVARQSGEGERDEHLAIVECSDPNEGWSLSIKFGSGDQARDRMRALSDHLRAGEA